ncbi:TetR/AcrR family transcriptional regulator [Nocardia sp. NPDC004278]
MARAAKFTRDDILDAAATVAAAHGRDATIGHVAAQADAPVGSIYHRFRSRDELFVSLWLRSIRRFHIGYLQALNEPDPNSAAIACAVHIPRFCRDHPAEGVAMTMYRQTELVSSGPPSLMEDIVHINDAVTRALLDLSSRRYPVGDNFHLRLIAIACQESPYGLVRPHLRSAEPIPTWVDDVVRASTAAILALGDSAATSGE